MSIPLAYRIPLPNSAVQGVATADRPLCALTSAYASYLKGEPLLGTWKTLTREQQLAEFVRNFKALDVPAARAERWAASLNGELLPFNSHPRAGSFTLDPYQLDAVKALGIGGGVLALGCGLGKTATAVKAAIDSDHASRIWIICPLNAIPTWERWRDVLDQKFEEVQILSMDSAHKFTGAANVGGVIIFDECHLLGDCDARRTKSCHKLRPLFDFGLCLTGTLLHGGVEKTLSIMDLAVPGGALFANRWKAGEYFNCLVRKFIGSRRVTALEKPQGAHREAFLQYISRLCISLNAHSESVRQSIDIPEQTITTVRLGEPWEDLNALAARYVHSRLAEGQELPHAQAVAHALCRDGTGAKLDWLLDLLGQRGDQAVVFAAYRDTLDQACARFADAGISVIRVDGDVVGAARQDCERRFQQGEARVFLGQMDAACTSMNLQNAHLSTALDHTWKAANYNQALARTCRRGQSFACDHYDLVCNELQNHVVKRLAASEDFDASLAEWQALRTTIQGIQPCAPSSVRPSAAPTPPPSSKLSA